MRVVLFLSKSLVKSCAHLKIWSFERGIFDSIVKINSPSIPLEDVKIKYERGGN